MCHRCRARFFRHDVFRRVGRENVAHVLQRMAFSLRECYGAVQVPAVKLLLYPFIVLEEPMLVLLFDTMPWPNPVPPPKVLLFTQALVDPRCRPCAPGPLMVPDATDALELLISMTV